MPKPDPTYTNKRERDSDEPISPPSDAAATSGPAMTGGPRTIAGSRRVPMRAAASRRVPPTLSPALSIPPMYGDEHRRMSLISPTMSSAPMQPSALSTHGHMWAASRGSGDAAAFASNSAVTGMGTSGLFSFDSVYQGPLLGMSGPTPAPPLGSAGGQYQYRDARGPPMSAPPGGISPDTTSLHRGLSPFSIDSGMAQSGPLSMWSQALSGFE